MRRLETKLRSIAIAFFALLVALPASARLQDEGEAKKEEANGEEKEDEEEDRYFAILGGDVYTGSGGLLRNVTILSKNGKIEEIGRNLYLPDETETLDATGMRVYPGLVALGASSSISRGLFWADEDQLEEEHEHDPHFGIDDAGEEGPGVVREWLGHVEPEGGDDYQPPYQAETEKKSGIEDSFDPFSQYLVLALATGITTAEQSSAAVKLKRGEIDGILLGEKNLVTIAWSVGTPSTIRSARDKFAKASAYLREYRAWDALSDKVKKEQKEPSKKGVDSNALRVLSGEALARFNAQDRENLLGIAHFAQEYHFRPVIFGGREGWTVADELGRAGAYAIVTPRDRVAKDERLIRAGGSSIENAAILYASGVQVAIKPASTGFDLGGITGRDLLHYPVEVAFGVRGGLPEDAAIESMTIVPARILGVDHRVGSLEVGKDMDAIVTDGDLLHYQTFVQWAVVDGKLVYDKQEEIFFAHIRPRPEPEPEPEPEEEEPEEEEPEEEGGEPEEGAGEEEEDSEEEEGEGEDEDEDEEEGGEDDEEEGEDGR